MRPEDLGITLSMADAPDFDGLSPDTKQGATILSKLLKDNGLSPEMTSGYRDEERNKQAGGVVGSNHTKGSAVDFYLGENLTDDQISKAEQAARDAGFDEILFHDAGSGKHLHAGKSGGTSNYNAGMSPFENFIGSIKTDNFGMSTDYIKSVDDQEREALGQPKEESSFMDRFLNQSNNSPIIGVARVNWAIHNLPSENNYVFSKEDQDYVNQKLPNDKAAQTFVYSFANSREQLEKLVDLKVEDKARSQRVENSSFWDLDTFGTILGFVVGEGLNPMNYVGNGLINKGSLAVKMLQGAAINAAINVADSEMRERMTGYEENFKWSAATGALVGAAIPALGKMVSKVVDTEVQRVINETSDKMVMHGEASKRIISGADSADVIPSNKVVKLKAMHDTKFTASGELDSLIQKGDTIVVGARKRKTLEKLLGVDIPKNTKAFVSDGVTVLFREAIQGLDDKGLKGLLMHEVGVHGLSAEAKAPLLKFVQDAIKNPKGVWREAVNRAIAANPDAKMVDAEEVLGYFAEIADAKGKGGYFSKLRDIVRTMFNNDSLTDDDVLKIIKKNLDDTLAAKQTYRTLEDGSVVVGNIKMSQDNILNPNTFNELVDMEPNIHSQDGVKLFGVVPIPKAVSKGFENSWLYATPAGRAMNSKIPAMKSAVMSLVEDARMRAVDTLVQTTMPAETVKKYIYGKFANHLYDIRRDFRNYLLKNFKAPTATNVEDTWKKIVLYHDHIHEDHTFNMEIDGDLKQIAEHLYKLETTEIKMAKEFGFIDSNWKVTDQGTRRVTSMEKWRDLVGSYQSFNGEAGIERLKKDLEEYARQAMYVKKGKNKELLQGIIDKENKKLLKQYEKDLTDWEAKGSMTGVPKPEKPILREMSEEELDKFITESAHNWAYGQLDRDTSSLLGNKRADGSVRKGLPWFMHRVAMDTSYEMQFHSGRVFSFDNDLRSYDFDFILDMTTNRLAGEIALKDALSGKYKFAKLLDGVEDVDVNVENMRQLIQKEGEQRVLAGAMSNNDVLKDLEAFDFVIDRLRGVISQAESKNLLDVFSTVLRNYSYARNGGGMGFNQIMEVGSSLSYLGARMLMSVMPDFFSNPFKYAMYGKKAVEQGNKDVLELFGKDMRALHFARANMINSKMGRMVDPLGFWGSKLDKVNNVANVASEITSTFSGLQELTKRMIDDIKLYSYLDVVKFARGEQVGWWGRKPFSDKKLAAIGVTDAKKFREALSNYLSPNGEGLDLIKMKADNETLYFQVYNYIDKQVKRSITESTIGNTNMLAESNWFARMFFQFKSFTNMAVNAQFFQKMTNMERDDFLATAWSMMTSLGVTYGVAHLNGWARYSDNESKRKEYIKTRTSPAMLARIAVLRSAVMGAPLSNANDLFEALTGSPTIRTTVNRERKNPMMGDTKMETLGNAVGNTIKQLPAIDLLSDAGVAVAGATDGLSKRDMKNILNMMPNSNYFASQYLYSELLSKMNLKEK